MLSIRLALLLLASAVQFCSGGYVPPTKYLIVSNARNGTIGYVKLSRTGQHSPVRILIDKQLVHPQGIAVDQKRQLLLIADSELKKVVSYGLLVREDGSLGVDEQTPVAEDVEARWVTVDGLGNVYLTDEEQGKVFKISARQMLDGDTEARPAYAEAGPGDSSGGVAAGGAVSAPGGIATDNFHVFWTNKEQGETVGTVMKALQVPGRASGGGGGSSNASASPQLQSPKALAKNLAKAYGLCLALDSLFFTGPDKRVYAVKTTTPSSGDEGVVTVVASDLENPRGCAWDGESTVFVADRSADGVFAISGPPLSMTEASSTKVVHFEGAFGVAVFSSDRRSSAAAASAALWAALLALSSALLASSPSAGARRM
mmetsp:Transcript_33162/g.95420  ORF Transcript_33162/g.95420 Transcript_33162/m.95420 type:complete len:372 (-) Transcript_33162:42-1157(-)